MNGISELRKNRGLTQQALADLLDVQRPALAMWEIGKAWPPSQLLPKLASALGCSLDDLYSTSSDLPPQGS